MPSPYSEAVVLLGRGMPNGEQAVALNFAADQLRAERGGTEVRIAFLEITSPGLTDVLAQLSAEGFKKAILAPAFLPWDRNIRAWLPRYLSGWAAEQTPDLEVVITDSLDETPEWYAGLKRNVDQARDRPPVTVTHRPLYRRAGRSTVPPHRRQILVCLGPRCAQAGGWRVMQEIRSAIASNGLNKPGPDRVMLTRTACQHPCNLAPLVTVQPDNVWYGNLDLPGARQIVEQHLVRDHVVAEFAHYPGDSPVDDAEHEPAFPSFDAHVGDIDLQGIFVRPAMHLTRAAAAFMVIRNQGTEDDELIGAATPLAMDALVHGPNHAMPAKGVFPPLALPAGAEVVLEPGELHMMLTDLKAEMVEGDPFPLDLIFRKAGTLHLDLVFHPAPQMD